MVHRMKHFISLSLILMVILSLAACGQASDTNRTAGQENNAAGSEESGASGAEAITVQDARGELKLEKVPERIVAMDFSFTDMLVSLGVQPVGIADDGSPELFMDSVKDKLGQYTSVGSRYEPNIELISSVQPDLIIADINKHSAALAQLEQIAPVLVLDDFQADYDQMLKNFNIVAKAVGKEKEGATRLAEHEQLVKETQEKLSASDLTILPAVVNPTGFFGHSDHSYTGSIVKLLGFTDPLQNEKSYPELALEQLVELNPQVLFLMPTEDVTIVNEWEKNPLWSKIDAVVNKHIYTVERRNWSLSRGLLGSEQIMLDIAAELGN
ncbi:Fe(3+) dicitrate ABC transporter substrate-binding protein [Paenibacillus enshidis]|uniref:Fe(3+) dicitrate ABC transporter substrate-binding protein n=1 Tax=Paenibacillus enshidis TaxID=1458439 RepID=A0ABV5AZ59_9BACL